MARLKHLTALLSGLTVAAAGFAPAVAADLEPAPEPGPTPAVETAPATNPGPTAGSEGLDDDTYDILAKAAKDLASDDAGAIEKAQRRCEELAKEHKAAILASLHDSNALKRNLAIKLAPYVGDDAAAAKAVGELLAGDKKDESDHVRLLAAMTLYRMPDPAGFDAVVSALQLDTDKKVRAAAAQALGKFNDNRAVEPLLKALGDSYAQVRGNAAAALGILKLEKEKVLAALLNAVDEEPDLAVKARMQGAIQTLQGRSEQAEKDDKKGPLDLLGELADEMGTIEDKLRNDEHRLAENAQVVDQQNNVVQRLDQLVKKLEEQQQQSSSSSSGKQKKPGPKKPGQGQGQGQGQPSSQKGGQSGGPKGGGAQQSNLPGGEVQYGEQRTETGSLRQKFADLPDAERAKLNNLSANGVPENWVNVLESYWMSVNKIEAKENAERGQ